MSSKNEKPIFTLPVIMFLLVLFAGTGFAVYWSKKPAPKIDPHSNNPNVIKLRPVPKEKWKPTPLSPEQKYMGKYVFPFVKKHQKPIKDCYFSYKGKQKRPQKGAKVTLQFFVKSDGTIEKTTIFRSELKIAPIHQCIIKVVKKWKFHTHKQKKPIRLQYPFFFR